MALGLHAGRAEKTKLTVAVVTVAALAFVWVLTEGDNLSLSGGGQGDIFRASVPNSYRAGAHHFTVAMFVWKDSSESQGAGSSIFRSLRDAS